MSTRLLRLLLYGLTLTLLLAPRAWSQEVDDNEDNDTFAGHLQLIGGVTNAARTQPFFGGGLGLRVSFFEVDLEAGHFEDVLAGRLVEELANLQRERNLPVQAGAEVPANYVLGMIRFIVPAGPVRPFIGAGYGVARLSPRLNVSIEGVSLGDVFGLAVIGSRTEPLGTVTTGVRFEPGRVHVELGYRFVAIFTDYRGLNLSSSVATYVHSGYAALGVKF